MNWKSGPGEGLWSGGPVVARLGDVVEGVAGRASEQDATEVSSLRGL